MGLSDLRGWLRTLHAEGGSAARDRALERRLEARRRASVATGAPPAWPAPPVLNVLGGPATPAGAGLAIQAIGRLTREAAERPVALLSRESASELRLEWWHQGQTWARTIPVAAGERDPLAADPGWLEGVRAAIAIVGTNVLHIESLGGLSLRTLAALVGQVRLVVSVHDFSPFCRRPRLWQASGGFCDYSRDDDRCRVCLEASALDTTIDQPRHRALATGVLRRAALIVFPSRFLLDQTSTLLEGLPSEVCAVVPPGLEYQPGPPSSRRPDQVAFLGGGADHLGGARFARLAAILAARGVGITVYGGRNHHHLAALQGIDRVKVRGYYLSGTLPLLLVKQGAAAALLLSRVPTGFSLTVSESWAAGVPVVAPATGAHAERLRDAGGELVGPDPTDHEVITVLDRVRQARDVRVPQPPTATGASLAMLAHYRRLGFLSGR